MTVVEQVPVVGPFLPNLIGAAVILVVGWLIALLVSRAVGGLLRRTELDNRLATAMAGGRPGAAALPIEIWAQTVIFWLIFLFVLVAVFQTLGLTQIAGPVNELLVVVLGYLPRLLAAAVLALIAWVLATVARLVVSRALATARVDERVASQVADTETQPATATAAPAATAATARPTPAPLSSTLGEAAYWLVWLLFLPAILDALNLGGILTPVQGMLNRVIAFLPNLVAAGLILLVGWFVAGILRRVVANLLAAAGADRLAERVGLARAMGPQRLSDLLALVVYVLVLLPVLTAALNALGLDAVTRPVSRVLETLLSAIPNLFAAALILVIAFVVGRLVAGLVAGVLAGMGFDRLLGGLGLRVPAAGSGRTPSETVGSLVLAAVVLFAAIEAARQLGFLVLADLLAQLVLFAAQVLLGLVILAIGLYLSNLAAGAVRASGLEQADVLATVARVAILVLATAMALRQMGVANEIVQLAFGLLLGAVAVAAALAFGLGGREIASRQIEAWLNARRERARLSLPSSPPSPPAGSGA